MARLKALANARGAEPSAGPQPAAFSLPNKLPVRYKGLKDSGQNPANISIAVGPKTNIEAINSRFAIFDKKKFNRTIGDFVEFSDWVSFSGALTGSAFFDPWIVFDATEGRWYMVFMARRRSDRRSWYVVSASASDNPFDGFWQVMFLDAGRDNDTTTDNWAGDVRLGYDGDSIFLTSNQYAFQDDSFQYAKIRVLDKQDVITNRVRNFTDFVRLRDGDGALSSSVQPCVHFGTAPAAFFVNAKAVGGKRLTLRSVTGGSRSPALGAPQSVRVGRYGVPADARQKGTRRRLDTGDARLLNASWREGAIWTAQNVATRKGVGIRWYSLSDGSGGRPKVLQSGKFSGRKRDFFYPAILPTSTGGAAMVFCRSGKREFAGAFLTGRRAGDPLGKMATEREFAPGKAAFTERDWGAYNGISLDPSRAGRVFVGGQSAVTAGTWTTTFAAADF